MQEYFSVVLWVPGIVEPERLFKEDREKRSLGLARFSLVAPVDVTGIIKEITIPFVRIESLEGVPNYGQLVLVNKSIIDGRYTDISLISPNYIVGDENNAILNNRQKKELQILMHEENANIIRNMSREIEGGSPAEIGGRLSDISFRAFLLQVCDNFSGSHLATDIPDFDYMDLDLPTIDEPGKLYRQMGGRYDYVYDN